MKNHLIKALITTVFCWPCCLQLQAQQEPLYSQYMFNGIIINPAYSSVDESSSLTVVGRNQWVGVEGAPKTVTASFYSPVKATNTSLGFSVFHEKITVNTQTGANFNISQRVKLNEKIYLALGLKGGMSQYREDNSSLSTVDPLFAHNQQYWRTDIGFGFTVFTDHFFIAISSPSFKSYDLGQGVNKVMLRSHYYLQAGYLFKFTNDIKLKPNLMVRGVSGAGWQYDLNANVLLKNLVWLGISWRSEQTLTGLMQVQVTKNLQIGYAYDTPMQSNLKGAQTATHELMINYRFSWSKWKIVAPRYF